MSGGEGVAVRNMRQGLNARSKRVALLRGVLMMVCATTLLAAVSVPTTCFSWTTEEETIVDLKETAQFRVVSMEGIVLRLVLAVASSDLRGLFAPKLAAFSARLATRSVVFVVGPAMNQPVCVSVPQTRLGIFANSATTVPLRDARKAGCVIS